MKTPKTVAQGVEHLFDPDTMDSFHADVRFFARPCFVRTPPWLARQSLVQLRRDVFAGGKVEALLFSPFPQA